MSMQPRIGTDDPLNAAHGTLLRHGQPMSLCRAGIMGTCCFSQLL